MNLLMDYIIMSPVNYKQGRFNYFKGNIGGPQDVEDPPLNTGLEFIDPTASDPLVFSCMDGSQPLALVCVVGTDSAAGTSTGRYFLCRPAISGNTIAWTLIAGGTTGITLKYEVDLLEVPVAGNPQGIAQSGDYLHILGYDADNIGPDESKVMSIYTVGIAALKLATGGEDVTVTATTIDPAYLPVNPQIPDTIFRVHGNGLIALTDTSGNTFLFALFNGAAENETTHMPTGYGNGTVVRLEESNATLSNPVSVTVGKNAMGLVPLPIPVYGGTPAGIALAVPCLGGLYQYGQTNGTDSALYRIVNIFAPDNDPCPMAAAAAIIGAAGAVPSGATRDIKGVTFSEDGLFGYVLTVTYDNNPLMKMACWKLYQTTAANILNVPADTPITAAINNNLLVFLEGADGANGNDWEVLYENEADPVNGRLWFVQGVSFRVSQGSLYSIHHDFVKIWADPEHPNKVGYINSADLIREMIYQNEKGRSIDTRLIKGKTAPKATLRAAALRAAAPAEEEEEKK